MKTLAIIGAGHLGQQLAHYAVTDNHYANVVFFDDISTEKSGGGFEILGTTASIEKCFSENKFDEILIGIGYKHLSVRKSLFEKLSGKIPFGTIIHSTVWIDPTAKIGQGCVVYPGCLIDANAVLSENTIINIGCTIAHDSYIGKHCFLSPRVAVAGFVKIGDQCIIGINATIIDNIAIANQVQLGGGTVVIKNIDSAGLYVGNPSRFIR